MRPSNVSQKFEAKIMKLANEFEESLKSKRSTQCSDSVWKVINALISLKEVNPCGFII